MCGTDSKECPQLSVIIVRISVTLHLVSVGLAQNKGYFAQIEHSKGSRSKTCKAVPLEWLP